MKNYIKTYSALSKKLCKTLVKVFDDHADQIAQPGVVQMPNNVATDYSLNPWLKRCMEFGLLEYEKIERQKYLLLDEKINKAITETIWKYAEEFPHTFKRVADHQDIKTSHYSLRKYSIGDYFNWHTDAVSLEQMSRVLGIIIYLNDVNEGGETLFELPSGEEYAIKPETGKLLLFPSNWMYRHKGAIPVSNPKYVITCFVKAY